MSRTDAGRSFGAKNTLAALILILCCHAIHGCSQYSRDLHGEHGYHRDITSAIPYYQSMIEHFSVSEVRSSRMNTESVVLHSSDVRSAIAAVDIPSSAMARDPSSNYEESFDCIVWLGVRGVSADLDALLVVCLKRIQWDLHPIHIAHADWSGGSFLEITPVRSGDDALSYNSMIRELFGTGAHHPERPSYRGGYHPFVVNSETLAPSLLSRHSVEGVDAFYPYRFRGRFVSKDTVSDLRLVHTSHDSGPIHAKFLGARTALFPQRAGVDLSGHCSATLDGRPSEVR